MSFDEKAKNWDSPFRKGRSKTISEEIKKNLIKEQYDSSLEFGCGTALLTMNLLDVTNSRTCQDQSLGMLEVVNEKRVVNQVDNLIATSSNVMDIENVFDLVYTSMVLHHIENHKKILADIHSKMVSGGEFFIIDLNPEENKFHSKKSGFKGHAGFNQEVLRTDLLEVGFDVLRSYTFYENIKRVDDKEVPYSLFIMHCVKN